MFFNSLWLIVKLPRLRGHPEKHESAVGVINGEAWQGKQRRFSAEYKAEAVRLVGDSGKSTGVIARELGLGETALRRWVQQAEVNAGRGPARALTTSEREELAHLRREHQRLRMEREILKKRRPYSPGRACEIRFH